MLCSSPHLRSLEGSLLHSCFPAWSYPALHPRTLVLLAVAGYKLTLQLGRGITRVAERVLLLGPKTL